MVSLVLAVGVPTVFNAVFAALLGAKLRRFSRKLDANFHLLASRWAA
jgi:hypothetical protein